ncbi:hypothetical protein D3C83_34180 [compost metagenome]
MHDLVREHAGQLGLVAHLRHQPARDEDVPAGRGEGVQLRRVEHAELPRQVGALGLRGEPAADAVHVALQALVGDERRSAEQLRGELAADLDLLLFGDLAGGLADVLGGVDQPVEVQPELRLRRRGGGERQRGEQRGQPPGAHWPTFG